MKIDVSREIITIYRSEVTNGDCYVSKLEESPLKTPAFTFTLHSEDESHITILYRYYLFQRAREINT